MIGTSFSQPMINPQLATRSGNTLNSVAARGVSLQTSNASASPAAKSGCGLGFVEIIAGLAACCCLTTFGAIMGAKKLVGAVFNKVKSAPAPQDEAAEV